MYNYTQLRRAASISPRVHDLGVDELDQIKQIKADADAAALEGAAGFIRGSRPMSEWGDFVSQLERVGVKQLEQIYNAAYERLKELL